MGNKLTEEMFYKMLDEVWNPPRMMSQQRPQLPPLQDLLSKVKRQQPTKAAISKAGNIKQPVIEE